MKTYEEIQAALIAKHELLLPGTCIAVNRVIRGLRKHGTSLLPVVEQISRNAEFPADVSNPFLRANIRELFIFYFEIADDNEWDSATLVDQLGEDAFWCAVRAVQHVWATNNNERRTVMPQRLFESFAKRLPADHFLLVTLNRLIRIGQLLFDRKKPGKPAPNREFPSIDEIMRRTSPPALPRRPPGAADDVEEPERG